jgi:hypothetical protein
MVGIFSESSVLLALSLQYPTRRNHHMRPLVLASAVAALLSLGSVTGLAAPLSGGAVAAPAPGITLVNGWWEQENRADASDRYWQLKRSDYNRYNSAQARIDQRHRRYHLDQYDHRDDRDLAQQHRILHFELRG